MLELMQRFNRNKSANLQIAEWKSGRNLRICQFADLLGLCLGGYRPPPKAQV
jgi:hypothetical protein